MQAYLTPPFKNPGSATGYTFQHLYEVNLYITCLLAQLSMRLFSELLQVWSSGCSEMSGVRSLL